MKQSFENKIKSLVLHWQTYASIGKLSAALMVRMEIIKEFQVNFDQYSIDFIFDSLINAGGAPSIVSEHGLGFAVTEHSWENTAVRDEREFIIHIPEQIWHPLMRLALKHYIDNIKTE